MAKQFGPKSLQAIAREAFVGNEDSDEYSRQPWKALGYIGEVAGLLEDADDPREEYFIAAMKRWVAVCGLGSYEGSDSIEPLHEVMFDILWDNGLHPYGYSADGYRTHMVECAESDQEAAEIGAAWDRFEADDPSEIGSDPAPEQGIVYGEDEDESAE